MYTLQVDASIVLDSVVSGEDADRLLAAMRKGMEDYIRGNEEVITRRSTFKVLIVRSYA